MIRIRVVLCVIHRSLPRNKKQYFFQIHDLVALLGTKSVQVMPDDHSKSVPPLPIPNRTVKRFYADDSAATSVKVGYCQASYKRKTPQKCGVFFRLEICGEPRGRIHIGGLASALRYANVG